MKKKKKNNVLKSSKSSTFFIKLILGTHCVTSLNMREFLGFKLDGGFDVSM